MSTRARTVYANNFNGHDKIGGSMRYRAFGLSTALLLAAGCLVNLDFLGRPELQEVVLVKSPAKEKILVVDVQG